MRSLSFEIVIVIEDPTKKVKTELAYQRWIKTERLEIQIKVSWVDDHDVYG